MRGGCERGAVELIDPVDAILDRNAFEHTGDSLVGPGAELVGYCADIARDRADGGDVFACRPRLLFRQNAAMDLQKLDIGRRTRQADTATDAV